MTTNKITWRELLSDYDESEVYYDESFQRRVVWDNATLNKFIESMTKGWAISPIVVADVKKCLKHSKKSGDKVSIDYFAKILSGGHQYNSIDGQNRTKKMDAFWKNKIPISGTFVDADGKPVPITNTYFKNLPPRLQDRILDCSLNLEVAPAILRSELSDYFQNLNSGYHLNSQEKRNAKSSPIAEWVRKTSKDLNDGLLRAIPPLATERMLDDELVAKMAMTLIQNDGPNENGSWDHDRTDIDRFYDLGVSYSTLADPGCPYSVDKVDKAVEVLRMWNSSMINQDYYPPSKRIAAKQAWAILYACKWICDNHYYIEPNSFALFFRKIKELDDKLATDSEIKYAADRQAAFEAKRDPDEISKAAYYFAWLSLPHQANYRNKRIQALVEVVSKDPAAFGLRMSASAAAK